MNTYIQDQIISSAGDYEILPITSGYLKMFSVESEGFPVFKITDDNENFHKAIKFLSLQFKNIVDIYKDEFAFSEPYISYDSVNKIWKLSVGAGVKANEKGQP